ncbi:hypothetical protein [Actinophytocola sediminis]
MSIRGFVLGMAVVVITATAGCAGADPAPAEDAPPPSAGVYAYGTVTFGESALDTESELLVMDGTKKIGSSGPLLLGDRPVFTTDGAYVYTLPSFLDEIIVISVADGEKTSVPCTGCGDRRTECRCQVVAPVGGSRLAWLEGADNHLVRVDLAAESPTPQPTDITVPTENGFLDEKLMPNLIAGTDGAALASYPGKLPGDDLLPAYLVPLEGTPRRLDTGRPDSIDEAIFSSDGTRIAVTGNQEYACSTVTVVDVASGKGATAPVSAKPGTTCEQKDVYVESLWWDLDGTLNVVFEVDRENSTADNSQRRLTDGAWVDAGTGQDNEVRQLSAGTATIQGQAPATLYLETDDDRTEIDTDVRYLTVAPKSQP